MTAKAHRGLTRRRFLGAAAALATFPAFGAKSEAAPPIGVSGLNHMTLHVSDVARSLAFYQKLFGMQVQARQGETVCLQIGEGPEFMALTPVPPGGAPTLHHLGLGVPGFEASAVTARLAAHGLPQAKTGESLSALHTFARSRDAAHGGAPEGTSELYLLDPDGLIVQLQDPLYCGGGGVTGERCEAPPPPQSGPGRIALRGINHFSIFVSNASRSIEFYQQVFDLPITKTQGDLPLLDAGEAGQLLAFVDGGGRIGRPRIHHACVTMEGFQHEDVTSRLADAGLQPREDPIGAPVAPLSTYVTMRMPDRGGAPGGTPELYFTDPDGILLQIQDERYCGGSGYLGERCAYLATG